MIFVIDVVIASVTAENNKIITILITIIITTVINATAIKDVFTFFKWRYDKELFATLFAKLVASKADEVKSGAIWWNLGKGDQEVSILILEPRHCSLVYKISDYDKVNYAIKHTNGNLPGIPDSIETLK